MWESIPICSCWKIMSYPPSRQLFRTYPASSGSRKIILHTREGSSKSSYKVLKRRQLKALKLEGKKPTTQLYHLKSRWRSPRNIGFRQSAWGHSTCGHLHHDEYKFANGFQVIEWPSRKWNQRLVYLPKFTAWKLNSSPLKIYRPPKGSRLGTSNHPFSGATLLQGGVTLPLVDF